MARKPEARTSSAAPGDNRPRTPPTAAPGAPGASARRTEKRDPPDVQARCWCTIAPPMANDESEPVLTRGAVVAGRYLIQAQLGQGGFGAVFRATQIDLGRDVAL